VDGFIVPDLPPEEADELQEACRRYGLALVYLLAPTSSPERVALVAARSQGFIYLVSLTGVTGARDTLPPGLADFVSRYARLPVSRWPSALVLGLAIRPGAIAQLADGVIGAAPWFNRPAARWVRPDAGRLRQALDASDSEKAQKNP
jgi:tryptophan synthase alpha chain